MLENEQINAIMAFMKAIPVAEAQQAPGKPISFPCPICGGECTVICAKSNLHFSASCEKCGIHACE